MDQENQRLFSNGNYIGSFDTVDKIPLYSNEGDCGYFKGHGIIFNGYEWWVILDNGFGAASEYEIKEYLKRNQTKLGKLLYA